MFEAISQAMAAWVISVGSVLVPSESGTEVNFSNASLNLEENWITLTVELSDWLSDDMNQILESGQTLTIHFELDLYQQTDPHPLYEYSFDHAVTMDLIDRSYHIDCTELEEDLRTDNPSEMQGLTGMIRSFPLINLDEMQGETAFHFRLTAQLENIEFQGLMKNLEMMNFWKSKRPEIESTGFRRTDFLL